MIPRSIAPSALIALTLLMLIAAVLSSVASHARDAVSLFDEFVYIKRPKLWVNEQTSAAVKMLYPANFAKDGQIISQGHFDPDNNGLFDTEHYAFFTQTMLNIPDSYTGVVVLDWEGQAIINLKMSPQSPQHAATMNAFIELYHTAKRLRPNAQIGFYALPINRYFNRDETWVAETEALQPILDVVDCLTASIYDLYKTGESEGHTQEQDLEYVRDNIEHALQFADGKPVYAYMMTRYHDVNATWGFHLIPKIEFSEHVKAVFEATFEADRADGLVWFGSDPTLYEISQTYYPPWSPLFYLSNRLELVFANEIPYGMSAPVYFDQLHAEQLALFKEIIDEVP